MADIQAVRDRDAACDSFVVAALYFKGFQALQSYRIAHWLWENNRKVFLASQPVKIWSVQCACISRAFTLRPCE